MPRLKRRMLIINMHSGPKHEQLFVWMDANARMGRRQKGQVGSKDSKILGAYGRDILTDNGERCHSLTTMA